SRSRAAPSLQTLRTGGRPDGFRVLRAYLDRLLGLHSSSGTFIAAGVGSESVTLWSVATPFAAACQRASDCTAPGALCSGGYCKPSCSATAPCPAPLACVTV